MLWRYTLAEDDLEHINERRWPENPAGFSLQSRTFRYPGHHLSTGGVVPWKVLRFVLAQLGMTGIEVFAYAARRQTRQQRLWTLQQIHGCRMFSSRSAHDLKAWLSCNAKTARSNEDLARQFAEECRGTQTTLPGVSAIERLCADALAVTERRIKIRIVECVKLQGGSPG